MHYDGETIYRPPQEADSVLLQVMRGCSYSQCKFCGMYRNSTFQISAKEEVWADIDELATFKEHVHHIFLLNGDAMALPHAYLLEILLRLQEKLPHVQRISSYARIDTILKYSVKELESLKKAGLKLLYIGLETGSDRILKEVRKGQTRADILKACNRLETVGIRYWALLMNGLGGAGTAAENAGETASLLNSLAPLGIWVGSTTIMPNAPLQKDVLSGRYQPMDEHERLEEYILLLEQLTIKCYMTSQHPTVSTPVAGYLPRDKEKLLDILKAAATTLDAESLAIRREQLAKSGKM